jgi:hypothetical protein
MANSDSNRTCGECKFFVDVGHIGECRRFPKTEQKFSLHYCGEFVTRHVAPDFVFEMKFEDSPVELKKRGRPAKANK